MSFAGAMVVALAVDAILGWPAAIYARIGHPVTWLGGLVEILDRNWNATMDSPRVRRAKGVVACLVVVVSAVGPALVLQNELPSGWKGAVLIGILAWPFVALRSLFEHVSAVADPLEQNDLPGARRAVSMIVGRDVEKLDDAGVARAAIESLAENASDGVVAPVFWGAMLGLPGIAGYKAINTLDSMIGHRTPRHESFGWASARIDDLANLVPARLTALLLALVSRRPQAALACMLRDAGKHRSPNAGWPEAAMAGALAVRLSGPRVYDDRIAQEPWLNERGRDASAADIRRSLRLYLFAIAALGAIGALLAATAIG
ncbi:MAG: adenosylcobinamide-phosphate synthase CbiB [Hyphomicrobium sp.]